MKPLGLPAPSHHISELSKILHGAQSNLINDSYLGTCVALGAAALGLVLVVLSLLDLRLSALQLEDRRKLETTDSLGRLQVARKGLLQLLYPSLLACASGTTCYIFREWPLGLIAGISLFTVLLVVAKLSIGLLQIKIELT